MSRDETLFKKATYLLSSGDIRCTKKALADKLLLNAEETDLLFNEGLLKKGLSEAQKPNRHFVWLGTNPSLTLNKAA